MVDLFSTALTGLNASRERALGHANNLANLNTPGYKAQRVDTSTGPSGSGARTDRVSIHQEMGNLVSTGNPLDLAIQGQGYFALTDADGTVSYTRDGQFSLDSQGRMVNTDGKVLQPPVTVPQGVEDLAVGRDGTVTASLNGEPLTLGQIQLTAFSNPEGLTRMGGNALQPTGASGMPVVGEPGMDGRGTVISGFQESSNVDIAREMVGLRQEITITKANSAVVRTADEMQKTLLDILA
ncbi:MAG: flagellar hook-basal body complex protein [bacterium]|jgi:flagellar basal-body rod protein FlgG|nr:flagellar hook-basal body complex protein [bacterium]